MHAIFGGENSALLSYLIKISVTVSESGIFGVDSIYDSLPSELLSSSSKGRMSKPISIQESGGREVYVLQSGPYPSTSDPDTTTTTTTKIPFEINGPAGERSMSIQDIGDYFLGVAGEGTEKVFRCGVITALTVSFALPFLYTYASAYANGYLMLMIDTW